MVRPTVIGAVPPHIWVLFAVACLNVVFPIVDVPLMGISLSAPIFFVIILEITTGRASLGFWPVKKWKPVLEAFIIGLLLSYLVSALVVSDAAISWRDALLLLRYVYWVVVFVVTTIVVAHLGSLAGLVKLFGWAVIGLAVVWFWDRFDFPGATGELLTPNSYGFVFSTFWPFGLVLAMLSRRRASAALGLAVLGASVVLNGSRGSWIAISAATIILVSLVGKYGSFSVRTILLPVAAATILLIAIGLAPETLTSRASDKLSLSSNLEADKSWAIRKVMVRKGWQLFMEHPLFGVGAGRFTRTMAELELPPTLTYGSQDRFNRRSAHNSYVALLAEAGLAGSLPFVLILGGLAWKGLNSTQWLLRRGEIWSLAIYCSLVGMSIHMWVISALTGTHVWLVYGLVAGMIAWQRRMLWGEDQVRIRQSQRGVLR